MMKSFLYIGSVVLIGLAFYLRETEGSAGMLALMSIPSLFYVMIQTPVIVKDTYNKLNRRMLDARR